MICLDVLFVGYTVDRESWGLVDRIRVDVAGGHLILRKCSWCVGCGIWEAGGNIEVEYVEILLALSSVCRKIHRRCTSRCPNLIDKSGALTSRGWW